MLLSHYKFAVDAHPQAFATRGVSFETVTLTSSDGVAIAGWFVPTRNAAGEDVATIVVLHTLGGTREDMLDFALPLWEKGFNLLLIDMRGHGESGGEFFTYGYHEWKDVSAAIDYLEGRGDGNGKQVAVLGASAGGAVAIAAAARDRRIKALVSIASFVDLEQVVEHRTPWLPGFWRARALRKAERLGSFRVMDVSPVRDIAAVGCPVLIVHGDADRTIPFDHARRLEAASAGRAELHVLVDASHATMFRAGGEALTETIAEFIRGAVAEPKQTAEESAK
jgi:dipeptidyl aminopeptidase/acylaminoacyl peptidase